MKKLVRFFIFLIVLTFSSCDFTSIAIPTSLYVRTKADYSFTIANFDLSLSDYFSKAMIQKAVGDSTSIKVYDYFPNSADEKVQQFLVRMPIQEIPINFDDYLNQFNVSQLLTKTSFSKSVEIPSLNISASENINLQTLLNALVFYSGTSTSPNFLTGFVSITYSSGTMTIKSTGATGTVTLKKGADVIASGTFSSGVATLSFTSKTIYQTGMSLVFENTPANTLLITTTGSISSVDGLSNAFPEISKTITNPLPSSVKACKIGEGTLTTSLQNAPTGLLLSTSANITGGLTVIGSTTISLNDKALSSNDIAIACTPTLSGSFSLSSTTIALQFATNITQISSLTIEDDSFENLSASVSKEFTPEMINMIDTITFTESGVDGSYINSFPTGNDISLAMSIPIFGITSEEKTLESNHPNSTQFSIKGAVDNVVTVGEGTDKIKSLTVDFQIKVPGYESSNKKKMTVQNVTPGQTYTIAVDITPVINWKSVYIKNVDAKQDGKQVLKFSLYDIMENFKSKIGKNLASDIDITSLPVSLFFTKPAIPNLRSVRVKAELATYIGNKEGAMNPEETKSYILGTADNPKSMEFRQEPTLSYDSSEAVITNISSIESSCSTDLSSQLNKTKDTDNYISIYYNVTILSDDNITINKEDLSGNTAKIAVVAYLAVPLKFNVTNTSGIDINVLKLLGKSDTTDLFGRTSATDIAAFQTYLDALSSVDLIYQSSVLPFNSDSDINVVISQLYSSSDTEIFTLGLSGGSISLNPTKICKAYPLIPKINVHIPKDTFSITRNSAIKLNVGVTLHTDGVINVLGAIK